MRTVVFLLFGLLVGCGGGPLGSDAAFTLYRSSPIDPNMRIHVASFDSTDGEAYNRENCELAAQLFKAQPGVTVRYFCEKGRYRK
jgi:hypothetical protein